MRKSQNYQAVASYFATGWSRAMCCFLAGLLFVSCAHLQDTTPDREERLRERVQEVWEAKMKGDWDVVYGMTSRDFQEKVSMTAFIRQANMNILSYEIKKIKIEQDQNAASASIAFETRPMGFSFNIKVTEEWVWEEDEWKLSPPPLKLPGDTKK